MPHNDDDGPSKLNLAFDCDYRAVLLMGIVGNKRIALMNVPGNLSSVGMEVFLSWLALLWWCCGPGRLSGFCSWWKNTLLLRLFWDLDHRQTSHSPTYLYVVVSCLDKANLRHT